MKIRFLEDKDAFSYRKLRLNSLKVSPFAFSDSYEDQIGKKLSDFRLEIKKEVNPIESFTLGAFYEGKLVGFVKFKRDQRTKARHRASLYSLYVEPKYRGQGIAKKLILELFIIIKKIPEIQQLQLSSILSKSDLIEFYQRFGFRILGGIIKDDLIIENQYVDAIYMVKYLKKTESDLH